MERAHSSSDETQRFRSGMRNAARWLVGTAFLAVIAIQVTLAPPARAFGPSGLVSPDHIIAGSGDCFYIAHTPSGCGGWEIVRYFSDGSRDTDFHCASPDSCDTGASGAGLHRMKARGEELPGRVRDEAFDGSANQLFLLQDDGIHIFNAETGDSTGLKIDLPTAGEGFATPPKSISTAGSGASRSFFVVDANGAVWKRMIGGMSWDKYCNAPATASPDKFRDAAVKTVTSANEYCLYSAYTDGIQWTELLRPAPFWTKDAAFDPKNYRSIVFDTAENAYVNDGSINVILKRTPPPDNTLTTFVSLPGKRGSIACLPASGHLLVVDEGNGTVSRYSLSTGTEIPWGAAPSPTPTTSPTPTPIPAPTATSTPTPTPTATATPTPYSPPSDPPPLDPDQKALLEAMNILGLTNIDLQILVVLLNDPNAVQPGGQDILKDTYALVDFIGKLLLEKNLDLVSKIEDGSLSQETFDKALYTLAVYLQETLVSPKTARGTGATPLAETRCRGSVVEMTLMPGVSQGSFTTTFPEGIHEGEGGWRTHRLALLLNRATKLWERVLVIAEPGGTSSRDGVALAAKDAEHAVAITVTDGLSYDWNDTAGVVRVAMTVMTIEIPDGATAPTAQPRNTGSTGCSAGWPFGLLFLVPTLLLASRR